MSKRVWSVRFIAAFPEVFNRRCTAVILPRRKPCSSTQSNAGAALGRPSNYLGVELLDFDSGFVFTWYVAKASAPPCDFRLEARRLRWQLSPSAIVTKARIAYGLAHATAAPSLQHWPKSSRLLAGTDVKSERILSADQVIVASGRPVVVFNIAGHHFRLICAITTTREPFTCSVS